MTKINLCVLGMLLFCTSLFSQTTSSFFLQVGGAQTNYQDQKFSNVIYSGIGGVFNLGIEKENSRANWGGGLLINVAKESAATHDEGKTTLIRPTFYFRYAKKINDRLAIGGRWDILDFTYRNTDGLANNGNYYLSASDLLLTTQYQMGKLAIGLDLGLLSFIKEGTGFSFSAPQNGLEDGEFSYQNDALSEPFAFEYYELSTIGKNLKVSTNIAYQLNDRLSLGYNWHLRHLANVENYPVTMAAHQVTIRFNLKNKVTQSNN